MAIFNYAAKEVTLKIVYYGPGLSGKTTNIHYLYSVIDKARTGKLISLATETDRTLFFDFLPVELGKIKDFSVRLQLYTVPGQVKYNATRKMVLKGADAVVFIADSQRAMKEANMESFANMIENLIANNINPYDIAFILQYNKRDLPDILSIDELNKDLNSNGYPYLDAEAINGKGVQETFHSVTKLLTAKISKKHNFDSIQPDAPAEEAVSAVQEKIAEEPPAEEKIPLEETVFYQTLHESEKERRELQKTEPKEIPSFQIEKLDRMLEIFKETSQLLISINSNIKGSIEELSRELKKSTEYQDEMLGILRGLKISETIEKIKEKEKKRLVREIGT